MEQAIIDSLVFSAIGIVVLVATFITIDLSNRSYHLWHQIIEKQNLALALLMGCFAISIAIIIASAIHS